MKKDLEPYICMFEECTEPYTLFATTDAWLSHMQWEHTLQWRCNAPSHPPQYFAKEQDFDDHLRSSHAGTFTESQLPLLKRRSAQPAPKTFLSCPLCGHPPAESPDGITSGTCLEELPNHIAAHLQSIAVMSLPWREDLEEVASSNRTSAPRARDSVPDEEDRDSSMTFDESPHIITDETYVSNDETISKSDRVSRDSEWGFIILPPYDGHTTDPILRAFVSKLARANNVAASAPVRDLVHLVVVIEKYLQNIHPKPHICEKLCRELLIVLDTLRKLQALLETTQPDNPWFKVFVDKAKPGGTLLADGSFQPNETLGTDGPLVQLRTCLEEIQSSFNSISDHHTLSRNRFSLLERNLEILLSKLHSSRGQFFSILDQDNFEILGNDRLKPLDNDRSTIITSLWESLSILSPVDLVGLQNQIYQDSYCKPHWFLESQEFRAWISGRPWTLYIYGQPGAGKVSNLWGHIMNFC